MDILKGSNQAANPTHVEAYDWMPPMWFSILNDKQCLTGHHVCTGRVSH